MKNLSNIIESILYVSGKEIELNYIAEKLQVSIEELSVAINELKTRYNGECGINIIIFNGKIQFSSNPKYVTSVSTVLNPILEKELTNAMLETLAIIAYKQPMTRLDIEEIRGVDSSYAVQTLSKMSMIEVVGRKDTIGKPLLFGTTDEFLKRFSLTTLKELPDYDDLLKRIETMTLGSSKVNEDFYNSNRTEQTEKEEELPDFLKGETVEIIK